MRRGWRRTPRVAPRIPERDPATLPLSIVLIVYDMPDQALNTIRSLSPAHQLDVSADDYEILVVENVSQRTLDEAEVVRAAPNARYLRRTESGRSPAAAVNAGADEAAGALIAVAVDGARMMTPGVVAGILRAGAMVPSPVVSVPGYHLGDQLHQDAVSGGYTVAQEQRMLADLGWRSDGYRLFRRSVLSASCEGGFLTPIAESNCVAVRREVFDELGGFDEQFVSSGGGFVNLDFYRRAVDHTGNTLILLPGEGTFHQFHGGATTGAPDVDRDALIDEMRAEYRRLRRRDYVSPQARPILLGEIPPDALPFLAHSVRRAQGTDT